MKHGVLTLMLAGILICGCASRMNTDVLQARIREQSLQLTESQREIAKTRAELKQVRLEADRLRTELGQTNPNDAAVPRSSDQISKVHIYSLLSGGINRDSQPGDDAVVVQFAPIDRDGEPINIPGELELTLIDPQLSDGDQELGSWSFSAEDCQKQWTRGFAKSGFQFTLPLEEPAQHSELIIQMKYMTSDDRRFDANRRIKVGVPPADAVVRHPKRTKRPAQVFDELEDDPPPVGDFRAKDNETDFDESDFEDEKHPKKSGSNLLHSANWTDSTIPILR